MCTNTVCVITHTHERNESTLVHAYNKHACFSGSCACKQTLVCMMINTRTHKCKCSCASWSTLLHAYVPFTSRACTQMLVCKRWYACTQMLACTKRSCAISSCVKVYTNKLKVYFAVFHTSLLARRSPPNVFSMS